MKKMQWLTVLFVLLLATAARAEGVDLKVMGEWDFAFGWADNTGFSGNTADYRKDDTFIARQRLRTQLNFIVSEYLQGVLNFEMGTMDWGRPGSGEDTGARLDADAVNVETRRAYLDWMIPNTEVSVRMGVQGVSLPMANGYTNPVFSADVAGVVVNTPITDAVGLTAFWLRPFDAQANDGLGTHANDEMDMFGLTLPVSGEGWTVTPWAMYAQVGGGSGYYDYIQDYNGGSSFITWNDQAKAPAWWAGVAAEFTLFDPLTFGFDAMYGVLYNRELHFTDFSLFPIITTTDRGFGTRGWFVDAALNYRLDWGVPGLFAWYSSGDKLSDVRDKGQMGRMPVVGIDDGTGYTSFGFPGGFNIGTDSVVGMNGLGTWGVGAQIAEVSFIEDLSHTLRLAYYHGTNDHRLISHGVGSIPVSGESIYMTDKDYAWEVNFDHEYQIYENLTAVVELGYINLHLNKGTWGQNIDTDNAWKAQLLFQYRF
jgi:hypothetical protein